MGPCGRGSLNLQSTAGVFDGNLRLVHAIDCMQCKSAACSNAPVINCKGWQFTVQCNLQPICKGHPFKKSTLQKCFLTFLDRIAGPTVSYVGRFYILYYTLTHNIIIIIRCVRPSQYAVLPLRAVVTSLVQQQQEAFIERLKEKQQQRKKQ